MNIKTFLKGFSDHLKGLPGCANYINGICINDKPCKVLGGKPCKYFERAVLPTAKERGLFEIIDSYAGSLKSLRGIKEKTCQKCGDAVTGRNKFCAKCKRVKNREYQKRHNHKKLQK